MGALDVKLTNDEIAAIDHITQTIKAIGLRYVLSLDSVQGY